MRSPYRLLRRAQGDAGRSLEEKMNDPLNMKKGLIAFSILSIFYITFGIIGFLVEKDSFQGSIRLIAGIGYSYIPYWIIKQKKNN